MLPQDDMDCNKTCTVNVSLLVRMAHADAKRSGAKKWKGLECEPHHGPRLECEPVGPSYSENVSPTEVIAR